MSLIKLEIVDAVTFRVAGKSYPRGKYLPEYGETNTDANGVLTQEGLALLFIRPITYVNTSNPQNQQLPFKNPKRWNEFVDVNGDEFADFQTFTDFVTEMVTLPESVATEAVWGEITGTLSAQTDLQSALTARELIANKTNTVTGNEASTTLYASVKGFVDYLIGMTWLTDTIFGTWINARTAKTTPVDADQVVLMDSADSNKAKKLSWANIKVTLKTYFDGFYASKSLVENISFQDSSTFISAQTYVLELYAQYAYTINELKIISGLGTCTVAIQINGVSVTGISAVGVSTTIATGTGTALNTVAIGDKITLVLSSPSTLDNLQASLKTTRIP